MEDKIKQFINENWDCMLKDIASLLRIESVEDYKTATEDAPFGKGPRRALDEMLSLSKSKGFKTHNGNGYYGFAEFEGDKTPSDAAHRKGLPKQIGIIGHLDVVPAGNGWTKDPFDLTCEGDYLFGRGVVDDKGPVVLCLYAMQFWKNYCEETGAKLPFDVRLIFGCNEETDMICVDKYNEEHASSDFLFTPDAFFPVCYGEMGLCRFDILSNSVEVSNIVEIVGGEAQNAIPDRCEVTLKDLSDEQFETLKNSEFCDFEIEFVDEKGFVIVLARGKCAHASKPHEGENAIQKMITFLLQNNLIGISERKALCEFLKVLDDSDGSGVGANCKDDDFGALTLVGTVLRTLRENNETLFLLQCDSRIPKCTSSKEVFDALKTSFGTSADVTMTLGLEAFMVDIDSKEVKALMESIEDVVDKKMAPYAMPEGSYAREFACGVAFGPQMPWVKMPDFVGDIHSADEGTSVECLKQSLEIYIRSIGKLAGLL